jgi:hypothetical protein
MATNYRNYISTNALRGSLHENEVGSAERWDDDFRSRIPAVGIGIVLKPETD